MERVYYSNQPAPTNAFLEVGDANIRTYKWAPLAEAGDGVIRL